MESHPTTRNSRRSKRFWIDESHNVHAGVTAFKSARRNRYTRRESNRVRRTQYVGSAGLIKDPEAYHNWRQLSKPTDQAARARTFATLTDTMMIAMKKAGLI